MDFEEDFEEDFGEEYDLIYEEEEYGFEDSDEDDEDNDDLFGEDDEDDYDYGNVVIDASDFSRISFGSEQYSSGDIRDPVNIAVRKLIRIIRNNYYECLRLDENILRYFGNFLFSFDSNRIVTMNMDIFAPAVLFLNKYKNTISKKNIKDFIIVCNGLPYIGTDDNEGDGYIDLIRYIRMLSEPFREYTLFNRN